MNNHSHDTFAFVVFMNDIDSNGNPLFTKTEISLDGQTFGLQISVAAARDMMCLNFPVLCVVKKKKKKLLCFCEFIIPWQLPILISRALLHITCFIILASGVSVNTDVSNLAQSRWPQWRNSAAQKEGRR